VAFIFYISGGYAQDSLYYNNSLKAEAGVGVILAGKSGGIGERLALSVIWRKWGSAIRWTEFTGGNKSGNPDKIALKEEFREVAVLFKKVLSQKKKSQVAGGIGFGFTSGQKLNNNNSNIEELNSIIGLALELSFETAGTPLSFSLNLIGNFSSDASMIGGVLLFNLGYQK